MKNFESHTTQARLENIHFLHDGGASIEEIAQRIGMSEYAIQKLVERKEGQIPSGLRKSMAGPHQTGSGKRGSRGG